MRLTFLVPCIIGSAFLLHAAAPVQEATRLPDGGTEFHVVGVELLPIPNMPMSGKSNILWERALPGGGTITTHLQATLARDSQGRMYREKRPFAPGDREISSYVSEVDIMDPVAGSKTTCAAVRRECIITNYTPRKGFALPQPGWNRAQTRFLNRENLGTDQVVGFNAEGTRDTVTIQPGVDGNDRPIVNTREFWYSSELQLNVKVIRQEAQFGKQIVWISDLSRSEPEASLFQPPAGYTIRDARVHAWAK